MKNSGYTTYHKVMEKNNVIEFFLNILFFLFALSFSRLTFEGDYKISELNLKRVSKYLIKSLYLFVRSFVQAVT